LLDLRSEDPAVELRVRNTVDEERELRLHAVAATPTGDGSFSLGGDGTAAWLGLEDQQVVLAGGEAVTRIAMVDPGRLPEEATHVAVLLEAGTDSTLITRAARVIELGEHEPAGVPGWLVLLAALLLAATVLAHVVRARGDARARTMPGGDRSGAGPAACEEPRGPIGPATSEEPRVPVAAP
jgi:hypothetical protein